MSKFVLVYPAVDGFLNLCVVRMSTLEKPYDEPGMLTQLAAADLLSDAGVLPGLF